MVDTKDFNSILDLINTFPDEQTCIDHLEKLRWNGNVISPFDPSSKVYDCKGNRYKCKNTGKYFNVKTATLFDNTKIKLQKWFIAIYLITTHSKGISSVQLAKDLNVTQKTAWFMLHRIRNCFGISDEPLEGEVEVDETYVGGKLKNKHTLAIERTKNMTGKKDNKAVVVGMVQRNGEVKAIKTKDAKKETILPVVFENIKEGSKVYSDESNVYYRLNSYGYDHSVIRHKLKKYVVGEIHTNTIENFWSLVKRGFYGIYHYVSHKHMHKYLNSYAFRYNMRDRGVNEQFNTMLCSMTNRLTYNQLING